MRWRVTVEGEGGAAAGVEAAKGELARVNGEIDAQGTHLRARFEVEAPSVKRAARAAFVIYGRIAGQNEPTRFELERIG